ncbi:uncharacterized protein MYCFIDRAFT_76142 [Pseudocercospora fijiensis CIRAD86]|uniref:DUF7587 domain-containing protein n=1 Tax=Pseudocercospora fijiensis (strain CIRAD86) TaxID=383855 RepID=N1QB25_PSEFD|nr:uncharacterized protein MYCFIDRAFT_76142 [Pseudocercospora fijiensis CIRAD86]EME88317.1 hypothetical protein MYCFIDRAFT_76142 [Pseudocercospora fijiensis CIRAD86]
MSSKWLFRAYSDRSQGFNSSTLFAPKAALNLPDPRHYRCPDFDKAAELELALKWNPESDRLIFFSNSLLFALAVAAYRDSSGESDINIVCIDTDYARTPFGEKVVFENAASIFETSNHAGIKNSDGSQRSCSDVFVATECVELGRASCASYEVLKGAGLYALFPRYAPQLNRSGMQYRRRLNIVIEDMRAYGFKGVHSWTAGQIDTMAALASAFRTTAGRRSTFPVHVLAAFLAFKKADPSHTVLRSWLRRTRRDVVMLDEDDILANENESEIEQVHENIGLGPEVILQLDMMETLRRFQVTELSTTMNIPLSEAEINGEIEAWETWLWDKHQLWRRQRDETSRKPSRDLQNSRSRKRGRGDRSRSHNRGRTRPSNANYQRAIDTGSTIDRTSSSQQSQLVKKKRQYTPGNDGSSLDTAILLSDSDEEAEKSDGMA